MMRKYSAFCGIQITKRLALIFIIVLVTCVTTPVLAASRERNRDALTVGIPVDRCPVFYQEEDTGEIVGIGVDLMRTAAETAGYDVTFLPVEEQTLKDALDNEKYDVVMPFGSAIASSSGQSTIVSDNLIQTPFTLVTAGNKQLPPLNELRVGMLRSLGGGAETVRQLYPGIQIVMYESMDRSVKALRSGEVDALLHNSYVWSYVLQKPSYSDLTVQLSTMFSMDFRAGTLDTPIGRKTIKRLNDGIAAISDTRRQAITLDYTSRRLYRYGFFDYLHQYGMMFLLTGLLIAALVVITLQKVRTLRLEQEEKMRRMVDYDSLTGALSLNGFRKRVEELLRKNPEIPYLLAYVNIKNFKYINASLGMEAGDDLLRFWVSKSQESLSEKETMGRIEGDRFAVLRCARGEEQMVQDDEQVLDKVRRYFTDRGKENLVQICGGVYFLTPEDYQQIDVDRMLDFARVAERKVRDSNREGYEFYNPKQWEIGKRIADVVGYLPLAIQSGELQVWYQPQLNYDTGEIIGAEALCRWNHAKLGWLSPGEFIPTLESADRIYELDCFVWEKVCQDLHRWNEQGYFRSVSVNLSQRDIQKNQNIAGHFYQLIQTYGLTPDQIRIEITESAYVDNPELLIRTTVKLREFGFQVEMDDFGSGNSSLHMLKEVPVDRIKLDLHFLSGAGDPERGRIIVSQVVQMVHLLGMNLIAEGVENASQANFLQSRGCSEMQGFYFYKPMSVQEFERIGGGPNTENN
jgi:EAL domain-containing protein (putative c-di-GMP-specific phosphodiesterase class I)/GGDEF domain-containing protein/ABC-type amino acid transport substrate-binding protein